MPSEISVRVGPDSSLGASVATIAARLGVDLLVSHGEHGTEIGDRTLPNDAPEWQVEAAVLRSLAPSHILFLCVANSARSQMAEGLARAMAPSGVRISSAGSEPTRVRPQAIAALAEVGIDIGDQESNGMNAVKRPVDAVITLCAEETCPVWLERSWRFHWALPDPAGASDDPDEEMEAFRSVRDELTRRFEVLFG